MEAGLLVREDHGGITTLRLDHGRAHALDIELAEAMNGTLSDLARADGPRAIVLTGTGTIFSAGVDLFRLIADGPAYIDRFLPVLVRMFRTLFAFPRPVVAAINGHAIAGGCVMACAADYRVVARGTGTIGVPELRVGLPFPLVAMEIMRYAVTTGRLQDLVYRGKTFSVDEACREGLVDETVEPDTLRDRALAVAERLASAPAARFAITKQQLRAPTLLQIETHARETDDRVLRAWKEPSTIAAIRNYLEEKRVGKR